MRMIVTAGPTREYFDSVRFLSNPSSGKMGYVIATEAAGRGHDVILVSGPVTLPEPDGLEVIHVVSAQDMFDVTTSFFDDCQAVVMTAAVCDYRPTRRLDHKLRKQNRVRPIHLQPTRDILAYLGKIKDHRVLIGFAMEDHDLHAGAEAKLRRKRCDAMVLNGIGNIGGDAAEIEVFRADSGWSPPVSGTKSEIAVVVVDLVESLAGRRAPPPA